MHHADFLKAKPFLPLFGPVVFCSAAYLLYRALSQYDSAEIVSSIFATLPPQLALGVLFVAGSYFSLTLFDALAVCYRGCPDLHTVARRGQRPSRAI